MVRSKEKKAQGKFLAFFSLRKDWGLCFGAAVVGVLSRIRGRVMRSKGLETPVKSILAMKKK